MNTINVIVIIYYLVVPIFSTPQIFTNKKTATFCRYSFAPKKHTNLPDKLWTINSYGFTLHFSVCKTVQTACQNKTASCLIFKNDNRVLDLGNTFNVTSEPTGLESIGGVQCPSDPSQTLKLHILLQCEPTMKQQPQLLAPDDMCTFQVILMHPQCRPKCTGLAQNSYFLDLRKFPKDIFVQTGGRNFSFTVCGANRNCPIGISACELTNGSVTSLSSLDTQDVWYNPGKGELTSRGKYLNNRFEVLIKCNWETEAANPKYKIVHQQGKKYRFEIESSFGCVKTPFVCAITSRDNHNYDLSGLNKMQGWSVRGVPDGPITMNICGPLNEKNDLCLKQESQICQFRNNKYINRGSLMSLLTIEDDIITAHFMAGSKCDTNTTLLYSTRIEFKCSKFETGPIFQKYDNCVMLVVWETSQACPRDFYQSDNCYMNDRISNRNLAKLHQETDRVYYLSPTDHFIYNLCGNLHESCNNQTNVSICLKTGTKERILGWTNKQLTSDNGLVRMELRGDSCPNKSTSAKVNIQFLCSYKSNATEITVIEDKCKYDVSLYTEHSCASRPNFVNCTYINGNVTYDLSSLTQTSKNYMVSSPEVDYFINVCGPVITGPGVLCSGDTMICRNNKTENNIKYKYTSLGGVGSPRLLKGVLVLEAAMGWLCEGGTYYRTTIQFECTPERMAPVLMERENCHYRFVWRTPEACPQKNTCVIGGVNKIDLSNLKRKTQIINVDEKTTYKFLFCRDYFLKRINGIETSYQLNRSFIIQNDEPILTLNLNNTCKDNTDITKVIFHVECSDEELLEQEKYSFDNCVLQMRLKTPLGCLPEVGINPDKLPLPEESITKAVIPTTETIKLISEIKNCTLRNSYTGYEWNLNKIKPQQIHNIFVNFEGDFSKCDGVFCWNDKAIPFMCPTVVFNFSSNEVILNYQTENICDGSVSYKFEVRLNCSKKFKSGSVLMNESCKTVLNFEIPEACALLEQEVVLTVRTGIIAALSVIIILFIIVGLVMYYNRRKLRHYVPFNGDKSRISIYTRNIMD